MGQTVEGVPDLPFGVIEGEEHFRAIFETTPECVKLVSRDGTLLKMNASGLSMVGASCVEAVVGKCVYDLIAPEHRDAFREFNERVCAGERGSLEFDIVSLAGARHHMETRATPLRHSDGTTVQLAITRDITDRRRIERAALLLGSIVDSTDDAILSKDLNGIITSWNKSAERMFGYGADEAVSQSVAKLLIPADRQNEELEILARLRKGERVEHFETVRRRKDGTLLETSLTISPVRDASGAIIGACKIARDISDRKRTERAAFLLGAIVDSSDDAILSKDLNGIITSWNKSAERVFGYSAEEAIGQSVSTLLIPADRQNEEPEILARLRKGERVEHFETVRRRKDGTLIDISLTISPVRNASGAIIGASKIARDITAQLLTQRALHKTNEALKQANDDLEQFAYSASHDLQEPLRMVSAYGELLRKKFSAKLDENGQTYIGYVVEGALRMERLLRDLRAFTHASVGADGPPPVVDAEIVLNNVLANLKATIDENKAEISCSSLPSVCIHAFQLEQVFQNIIGNAIRYRSVDPPRIHAAAVPEGDAWKFSIQDNGIGIDPEYKEQIFGIFKRLHTASEYPGTGMGLAIGQRIVERAGGRIWVESEPGRGSTFFFVLPGADRH